MTEEFHYQVPWRTNSAHPGHHLSSQTGGEQEFYGHAPLISRPEPHNLDIHATLLDPFQQFKVRTFRQRGVIHVNLIADLSASMAFHNKMALMADFTEKAAYSAYRTGDFFAFFGCDEQIRPDFYRPSRWYKGGLPELAEQLRTCRPSGLHCQSALDIHDYLPRHRSLIFFISDFHFPMRDIELIFDSLSKHDVVPIILWHPQEYESLPRRGLIRYHDAETGRDRHLWMRASLREKIKRHFDSRRKQLTHLFMRYGRQPFFIDESFQPDQMTRYFYEF